MLTIQRSERLREKCVLNVLPCRINHNGAVNPTKRFWSPAESNAGVKGSYFRGRKLHGRNLIIPQRYTAVVLSSTEKKVLQETRTSEEEELSGEEEVEYTGVMVEQAHAVEVVVWGHEALPDGTADAYVRGLEEWIAFAEEIHSYPTLGKDGDMDSKRT